MGILGAGFEIDDLGICFTIARESFAVRETELLINVFKGYLFCLATCEHVTLTVV